ncbi:DoxX family protein [Belnapia sp. T18]|uniref:DoxX family protein n=1 Tax=Belnapia arida TaxID=2804533 RepID=A0ABS1TZC9_9PROT|nr:DoxX family protein [Belnapia arida]MBL6077778.1 DoxX family protein [Belnapia arida]
MPETSATTPYAAALLRIAQGVMFLAHGAVLKLGTFGLAGTMGYFASIGYPAALGAVVIAAEILGGLALIAGFATRWVSLALVPLMLGAMLQHTGNGWLFNVPGGGWEYPAFWTVTLLVQAGLGAGAWALDGVRTAARRPAIA